MHHADFFNEQVIRSLRTDVENELDRKRDIERRNAEAQLFDATAYRDMPEDLRSRAREWGLEAFMCLVWSKAFQCGYIQSERDRANIPKEPRS